MLVVEILGWTAASLMAMAVVEYAAHRWPMHDRAFGRFFKIPFSNHAVLHHGRYYRRAFTHDPDPASEIISMRMSVAEHAAGAALVAAPLWWFVSPVAAACFMGVVILHAVVWTAVHVEMHMPEGRWFARTRYYRYVRDFHHAHHLHPGKNFGAVFPPVMDLLFGTYHQSVPVPPERGR